MLSLMQRRVSMYCPRCGEQVKDNSNYCPCCGLQLINYAPVYSSQPKAKSSSIFKTILIVLASLVSLCAIIYGIFYLYLSVSDDTLIGVEDSHITFVKNGTPTAYPNITYDEAFSNFFSNRQWEYFVSTDGKDVVEFHGNCLYRDVEVEACIQFVLDMDEGTFEFEYLAFNDIPQSEIIKYALITAIFENQ